LVNGEEMVHVYAVDYTVSCKVELECLIGQEAMSDWWICVEKAYCMIFSQV
jgi:hypothetical protein